MGDLDKETLVVWHEHNKTGVPEHVFGVQRMDPKTAMDDAVDYIETCIAEDMSKAREDKSGITVSYGTGANGELYATTETDNQTTYYSIVVNARGRMYEPGPDVAEDMTGEETCYKCDTLIKYKIEDGKTVVVCPECGAVNAICNECTKPERENNACHECELSRDCEKLNKLMAKGVRK